MDRLLRCDQQSNKSNSGEREKGGGGVGGVEKEGKGRGNWNRSNVQRRNTVKKKEEEGRKGGKQETKSKLHGGVRIQRDKVKAQAEQSPCRFLR